MQGYDSVKTPRKGQNGTNDVECGGPDLIDGHRGIVKQPVSQDWTLDM